MNANWVSAIWSAVVAIVLAEIAAYGLYAKQDSDWPILGLAVGLVAVPLAPMAKDLTSAIATATNAFKTVRR